MNDDALNDGMNALKLLYQITGRKGQEYDNERGDFHEALQIMQEDMQIHAGLNGCIHGILYGGGREDSQAVGEVCRGYLTGTKEQLLKTAVFSGTVLYGKGFDADRAQYAGDDRCISRSGGGGGIYGAAAAA